MLVKLKFKLGNPRNTFSRETLKSKKCNWNAVDSICDSILDNLKNSIFWIVHKQQITCKLRKKKKPVAQCVTLCITASMTHMFYSV